MSPPPEERKPMQRWLPTMVLTLCTLLYGIRFLLAATDGYSFWLDELKLANNLVERGFLGLFQPLSDNQGAPPLFLVLAKASTLLFGIHDWAIRMPVYLISAAAFLTFWKASRHAFQMHIALLALLLFALNPQLTTYSLIFKQYVFDVWVLIVGFYLYFRLLGDLEDNVHYGFFVVYGVLATWFSHTALFVLAGLGSTTIAYTLLTRRFKATKKMTLTALLWATSFLIHYFLILKAIDANSTLDQYWTEGYLNRTEGWAGVADWLREMIDLFTKIGTLPALLAGALLFFGTIFGIAKRSLPIIGLLAIIAAALLFSALSLYPLHDRLSLFLVPVVIWIIAYGLGQILRYAYHWHHLSPLPLLLIILVALIPKYITLFDNKADFQQLRHALEYIEAQRGESDPIYAFSDANPAVRFYTRSLGFQRQDYSLEPMKSTADLERHIAQHKTVGKVSWYIWGRPYKLGTPEAYASLFRELRAQPLNFALHEFKNAYVLEISD